MQHEFVVMPQNWYKRRELFDEPLIVDRFEVHGFEKKDGHWCSMFVEFTSGQRETLVARVCLNETYEIQPDKSVIAKYNHCSVQGINPHGVSVILRLVE